MNNLTLVKELCRLLAAENIPVIIFGGWAEEMQNVISNRPHKDIDFLFEGKNLKAVKAFVEKNKLEIVKDHPHKYAFRYNGICVEIFLVKTRKNGSKYTNYYGKHKHTWPKPFSNTIQNVKVASKKLLKDYRKKHKKIEEVMVSEKS